MAKRITQGVTVVSAFETDETKVEKTIQQKISYEIAGLNAAGKRVVNVSAGPAIKQFMGVTHLIFILWETDADQKVQIQSPTNEPPRESSNEAVKEPEIVLRYKVVINDYKDRTLVVEKLKELLICTENFAEAKIARLPAIVKVTDTTTEATAIKKQLEAVGAKVDIELHSQKKY